MFSLSIITINRNNVEGLRQTIESVISQTFTDFEYLIIDGASTDNSVEIIKQYENTVLSDKTKLSNRLYWKSEPDMGIFNAMNKGIQKASGNYLLFLNSGDFLIDCDVLTKIFEDKPQEDIICGRCIVSDNGQVKWTTNIPDNLSFGFFFTSTLPHQATFIKKQLFDIYGFYREDLKLMSDWAFWIQSIILGSATVKKSDVIVSNYNMNGLSSDPKNKNLFFEEKNIVYNVAPLKYFIPDYVENQKYRSQMKIAEWAWSKPVVRFAINCIFKNYSNLIKSFKK